MLAKKWWEFFNICVIDISVSINFIGIEKLILTNKSHGVDFLIYVQNIYLLIINMLVLDNYQ